MAAFVSGRLRAEAAAWSQFDPGEKMGGACHD